MIEVYKNKYVDEDYEVICCRDLAIKCLYLRKNKLKRILY
jgi:hypothetical protein